MRSLISTFFFLPVTWGSLVTLQRQNSLAKPGIVNPPFDLCRHWRLDLIQKEICLYAELLWGGGDISFLSFCTEHPYKLCCHLCLGEQKLLWRKAFYILASVELGLDWGHGVLTNFTEWGCKIELLLSDLQGESPSQRNCLVEMISGLEQAACPQQPKDVLQIHQRGCHWLPGQTVICVWFVQAVVWVLGVFLRPGAIQVFPYLSRWCLTCRWWHQGSVKLKVRLEVKIFTFWWGLTFVVLLLWLCCHC